MPQSLGLLGVWQRLLIFWAIFARIIRYAFYLLYGSYILSKEPWVTAANTL